MVDWRGPCCTSEILLKHSEERQFQFMKSWGNATRIMIHWDQQLTDSFMTNYLDKWVAWANKYGVLPILAWWKQGKLSAWTSSDWQLWETFFLYLARRYGAQAAYDFINEPRLMDFQAYSQKMTSLVDKIHSIAPAYCIISPISAPGSSDEWYSTFEFEKTYPINRGNVVYTFHVYEGQSAGLTASQINSDFTKKQVYWMLDHGREVWLGEIGDHFEQGWTNNSATFLANLFTVLKQKPFSGACAWRWASPSEENINLLADWNGTPSKPYGETMLLGLKGLPIYSPAPVPPTPTPPPPEQIPPPPTPPPSACFIATECGFDEASLDKLREFRDVALPKGIVDLYYSLSPAFAVYLHGHPKVKAYVKQQIQLILDLL